ncbi:MAG: hypothetical protein JO112_02330 [Planctomycetes bacterium]|nr:hypothetical protein [Planctomycetota bacterium]
MLSFLHTHFAQHAHFLSGQHSAQLTAFLVEQQEAALAVFLSEQQFAQQAHFLSGQHFEQLSAFFSEPQAKQHWPLPNRTENSISTCFGEPAAVFFGSEPQFGQQAHFWSGQHSEQVFFSWEQHSAFAWEQQPEQPLPLISEQHEGAAAVLSLEQPFGQQAHFLSGQHSEQPWALA